MNELLNVLENSVLQASKNRNVWLCIHDAASIMHPRENIRKYPPPRGCDIGLVNCELCGDFCGVQGFNYNDLTSYHKDNYQNENN